MVILNDPKAYLCGSSFDYGCFVGEDGMYVLHANGNPKDNRLRTFAMIHRQKTFMTFIVKTKRGRNLLRKMLKGYLWHILRVYLYTAW